MGSERIDCPRAECDQIIEVPSGQNWKAGMEAQCGAGHPWIMRADGKLDSRQDGFGVPEGDIWKSTNRGTLD